MATFTCWNIFIILLLESKLYIQRSPNQLIFGVVKKYFILYYHIDFSPKPSGLWVGCESELQQLQLSVYNCLVLTFHLEMDCMRGTLKCMNS